MLAPPPTATAGGALPNELRRLMRHKRGGTLRHKREDVHWGAHSVPPQPPLPQGALPCFMRSKSMT